MGVATGRGSTPKQALGWDTQTDATPIPLPLLPVPDPLVPLPLPLVPLPLPLVPVPLLPDPLVPDPLVPVVPDAEPPCVDAPDVPAGFPAVAEPEFWPPTTAVTE